MRILYSLAINLYTLAIRIVTPFHRKARLMVRGWHDAWQRMNQCFDTPSSQPTLWFHTSSLGEFEQARPVLESVRKQHPNYRIVVTFFSPSGYEVRKNYNQADLVLYLPPDTRRNASRLVRLIQPTTVFFVKYDFWFNYMEALHRQQIPTYVISAIFRPSQYFFRWYGRWFRRQLACCFDHIFVQNDESLQLLQQHGITRCTRTGDTRFDRVNAIANQAQRFPEVERYLSLHEGAAVVVAGSSWPPDEQHIARFRARHPLPHIVWILAPHLINEGHLTDIERRFGVDRCVRYSLTDHCDDERLANSDVMIVDNIGMLSSLYRYAYVACVGGGFGVGIHNTLEAVTFGKPVLFGPNYGKFQEAHDLLACGGGFTFHSDEELEKVLVTLLTDEQSYKKASDACLSYVADNVGSSRIILNHVFPETAQ